MKIRLWYYIDNNGDGSASPRFFTTEQKALEYEAAVEACDWGEGFCESVGFQDIEVDDKGTLIKGMSDDETEHFQN